MVATEEVLMPSKVHNYDRSSTYRNDGECLCWRGSLGIVQCYKWGQTRLCTGLHALLPLPIGCGITNQRVDPPCICYGNLEFFSELVSYISYFDM